MLNHFESVDLTLCSFGYKPWKSVKINLVWVKTTLDFFFSRCVRVKVSLWIPDPPTALLSLFFFLLLPLFLSLPALLTSETLSHQKQMAEGRKRHRKERSMQKGIKQNETSFLQSHHYKRQRWNMISGAASSSVHWFVIAHRCVLWSLPDEHKNVHDSLYIYF